MSHRLSVVIPALNEERLIGATLRRLIAAKPHEIIVVDGGSTDRTVDICRQLSVRVIRSEPGRGSQLNVGAKAATGDALLFLHADALPPADFARQIELILKEPDVSGGAFRFQLDADHPLLRLVETLTNWRARFLQRPYGDQGLFTATAMFQRAGGFAEIALMEDPDFVRRLRRLGKIRIAPTDMSISARRWLARGVVSTIIVNQACVVAFALGVPADKIAHWRGRSAPPALAKNEPRQLQPLTAKSS